MRQRHVPERTCVACRSTQAKRQLVRVVRTPDGTVELDPTGKRNGRGAYVHTDRACWELALKRRVFDRALKIEMSSDVRDALASALEQTASTVAVAAV